ncbi:MAG: BrnA antitoxin family protein [Alphaproteobacteria bacterium]|nr:BrnA antitoxin family protein [Alphaproteobacteria bacterium]
MKSGTIVRKSLSELGRGKSDWARVDALTDADIEKAIAKDPDAAPILDEDWFRNAEIVFPPGKSAVSLRLDKDVLSWFKRQGRGYQSRMNAVLRAYMDAQKTKRAG